jgi:hypothetical protein
MHRTLLLIITLAASFLLAPSACLHAADREAPKPNIVFIVVDDLGYLSMEPVKLF